VLRAPARLVTQRLVIRCWEAGDGAALEEAIDASLAELRPWMPWAHAEPTPVEELEARIARFRDAFVKGEDFVYGIWDAGAA
jgi:hypothetical protein